LKPDQSLALCQQLLSELDAITTSDSATAWAHRILGAKNSLTATDARRVENAFQSKLMSLAGSEETGEGSGSGAVDKSSLALPEPRRIRDKAHLRFVAQQACLVCGRKPSDPHHLRFAQPRALSRKVSDEFTVPLCRGHHREVHRTGDEAAWWKKSGIDAAERARALWLETHPLPAPGKMAIDGVTSVTVAAVAVSQRKTKRNRSLNKRVADYETKPISATALHD
jgi:hypothetical protein